MIALTLRTDSSTLGGTTPRADSPAIGTGLITVLPLMVGRETATTISLVGRETGTLTDGNFT